MSAGIALDAASATGSLFPDNPTIAVRFPVPAEPWHTYGVRKMIVKNFFVYYLIEEYKRQVAVTAVIYGRRDQIAALREMTLE